MRKGRTTAFGPWLEGIKQTEHFKDDPKACRKRDHTFRNEVTSKERFSF